MPLFMQLAYVHVISYVYSTISFLFLTADETVHKPINNVASTAHMRGTRITNNENCSLLVIAGLLVLSFCHCFTICHVAVVNSDKNTTRCMISMIGQKL